MANIQTQKPKIQRKTTMKHMNTLIQNPIHRPQKDLFAKPARPSVFALIFTAFALAGFALSPGAQAVSPAPGGGYPNFNTAEGIMRFSALQPASPTRLWVLKRSTAIQRAAPTQPTVLLRSLATQTVSAIRRSVTLRSTATRLDTTQPMVLLRSLATQPATAIQPTVVPR